MENLNYDLPNAKEFARLQERVTISVFALYKNHAIARDIANRVILAISMDNVQPAEREAKINNEIAKESEAYFSDLWKYCFRYALKLTSNNELAQDISQDAIITLFQEDKQVEFVKGWLKRVVFNIAKTKLRIKQRERNLPKTQLEALKKVEPMQDENQLFQTLSLAQVKKYLDTEDYKTYVAIHEAENLRTYAKENGISYQTAREHKFSVLHNLKQNYLRKHGWENSQQILSFRQISNLKRFFKVLAEHAANKTMDEINRYCPKNKVQEIQSALANLKEVSDWGVRMLDERMFHVFVADVSGGGIPAMFILHLNMSKGSSIKIVSAKEAPLMGVIDNQHMEKIPMKKGKVAFSMDEIKELIAKSKVSI